MLRVWENHFCYKHNLIMLPSDGPVFLHAVAMLDDTTMQNVLPMTVLQCLLPVWEIRRVCRTMLKQSDLCVCFDQEPLNAGERLAQRHAFGHLRRRPGFDSREGVCVGVSVPHIWCSWRLIGTGWGFPRLGPDWIWCVMANVDWQIPNLGCFSKLILKVGLNYK